MKKYPFICLGRETATFQFYNQLFLSQELELIPDTEAATTDQILPLVKKKETEAQAYAAVWDLMAKLEKNLPMAFVFYGQDTLLENNKTYDEIGIFLPNSHFLKNLERHVAKAEAILYG